MTELWEFASIYHKVHLFCLLSLKNRSELMFKYENRTASLKNKYVIDLKKKETSILRTPRS